mmetsp:Transcript_17979/g.29587  ORF Transcript_17979/g.29587 Transcript_17979/m.29587 type:complete len:227 (+) Transcript_17979:41-721(+)
MIINLNLRSGLNLHTAPALTLAGPRNVTSAVRHPAASVDVKRPASKRDRNGAPPLPWSESAGRSWRTNTGPNVLLNCQSFEPQFSRSSPPAVRRDPHALPSIDQVPPTCFLSNPLTGMASDPLQWAVAELAEIAVVEVPPARQVRQRSSALDCGDKVSWTWKPPASHATKKLLVPLAASATTGRCTRPACSAQPHVDLSTQNMQVSHPAVASFAAQATVRGAFMNQ